MEKLVSLVLEGEGVPGAWCLPVSHVDDYDIRCSWLVIGNGVRVAMFPKAVNDVYCCTASADCVRVNSGRGRYVASRSFVSIAGGVFIYVSRVEVLRDWVRGRIVRFSLLSNLSSPLLVPPPLASEINGQSEMVMIGHTFRA
ncbi:hypothetical protein ACSRUE_24985 [Sorangium sp. KYC3313]|uniref:hypothetical protein n=1 Tax=Sorangium sp. KYC3313 TaxID=3449740 RepID=UPI003F897B66